MNDVFAKQSHVASPRSTLAPVAVKATRVGLFIGAAALTAACATREHVPPTPPGSSNPARTNVTESPLPSTSSAAAAKTASASYEVEPANQDLIKRGYRLKRINGELLYCKTQVLTGTHFTNTLCLTEARLKALDLDTQSSKDRMGRQTQAPCPLAACN